MRPRYKPPLKRRYFHSKPKIDKKDMVFVKNKIDTLHYKRIKQELENKEKKKLRSKF